MILRKLKLDYLLGKRDIISIFDSIFDSKLFVIEYKRSFNLVYFLVSETDIFLECDISNHRLFFNKKLLHETFYNIDVDISELIERDNELMQAYCLYLKNRYSIDYSTLTLHALPYSLLKNSLDINDY